MNEAPTALIVNVPATLPQLRSGDFRGVVTGTKTTGPVFTLATFDLAKPDRLAPLGLPDVRVRARHSAHRAHRAPTLRVGGGRRPSKQRPNVIGNQLASGNQACLEELVKEDEFHQRFEIFRQDPSTEEEIGNQDHTQPRYRAEELQQQGGVSVHAPHPLDRIDVGDGRVGELDPLRRLRALTQISPVAI